MPEQIFILKHYDMEVDNFKIFTNVDDALNRLREWLDNDVFLMHYALSKYELAPGSSEYQHVKDYNLDELIDVSEEDSDDISIIDSDRDESIS